MGETAKTNTDNLCERIMSNRGTLDLNQWIDSQLNFTTNCRILELCCGTGSQTQLLVNKSRSVVASDISEKSLEVLNSNIIMEFATNLQTIQGDIDYINFENNSFDIIFCAYGIYYSKNLKALLNKFNKWLTTYGMIIIVCPYGNNNKDIFNLLRNSEVVIDEFSNYVSSLYVYNELLPQLLELKNTTIIKTAVNEVVWNTPNQFLNYWRNTTFYDRSKEKQVELNINKHFKNNPTFINKKDIVYIESYNK